jgi:hypothetical protein
MKILLQGILMRDHFLEDPPKDLNAQTFPGMTEGAILHQLQTS